MTDHDIDKYSTSMLIVGAAPILILFTYFIAGLISLVM